MLQNWIGVPVMSRRLIAASSALSLAACVAGPVHQSATTDHDGRAVTPSVSVPPPHRSLTTMAHGEEEGGEGTVVTTMAIGEEDGHGPVVTTLAIGEEEDGGGTVVTTMAIGEEDGHGPVVTTLAIGEEEDGGGTMIEDQPLDVPDLQGSLVEPLFSDQLASVADIMARLRLSEG